MKKLGNRRSSRRRAFRAARRGVTDVPLELVIIIIILAIVIPVILAAFVSFTNEQALVALSQQANNVADTAVQVFDSGVNTTILLTLIIPTTDGPNFTIGAPLYPTGSTSGVANQASQFIDYSLSGSRTYYAQATNGAQTISLTGMTCKGGVLGYEWIILTGGTVHLALTKMGPGAVYCSQPVDSTFVEVSQL